MNGTVIPHTPIAVDFWRIRQCPKAQIFFLTHLHADHIAGLTPTWSLPIYCTPTTKKLLIHNIQIREELIRELEPGSRHTIWLDEEERETMTVTVIDANHCPGAAMFFFQGYFGNILHTGDFRYSDKMFIETPLSTPQSVDVLYLDNTYSSPECEFPSRRQAMEIIFEILDKHPDHEVLFAMRTLGKEDLVVAMAFHIRTWVVVSPDHYQFLSILGMPNVFTTDPQAGHIHVIPMHQIVPALKHYNEQRPTIAVIPTALHHGATNMYSNVQNAFVVPYSDHSSHSELLKFVERVRPRKIIPVVGANARGPRGEDISVRADTTPYKRLMDPRGVAPFKVPRSVEAYMKKCHHPQWNRNRKSMKRQQSVAKITARKRAKAKLGVEFEGSDDDDSATKSDTENQVPPNIVDSRVTDSESRVTESDSRFTESANFTEKGTTVWKLTPVDVPENKRRSVWRNIDNPRQFFEQMFSKHSEIKTGKNSSKCDNTKKINSPLSNIASPDPGQSYDLEACCSAPKLQHDLECDESIVLTNQGGQLHSSETSIQNMHLQDGNISNNNIIPHTEGVPADLKKQGSIGFIPREESFGFGSEKFIEVDSEKIQIRSQHILDESLRAENRQEITTILTEEISENDVGSQLPSTDMPVGQDSLDQVSTNQLVTSTSMILEGMEVTTDGNIIQVTESSIPSTDYLTITNATDVPLGTSIDNTISEYTDQTLEDPPAQINPVVFSDTTSMLQDTTGVQNSLANIEIELPSNSSDPSDNGVYTIDVDTLNSLLLSQPACSEGQQNADGSHTVQSEDGQAISFTVSNAPDGTTEYVTPASLIVNPQVVAQGPEAINQEINRLTNELMEKINAAIGNVNLQTNTHQSTVNETEMEHAAYEETDQGDETTSFPADRRPETTENRTPKRHISLSFRDKLQKDKFFIWGPTSGKSSWQLRGKKRDYDPMRILKGKHVALPGGLALAGTTGSSGHSGEPSRARVNSRGGKKHRGWPKGKLRGPKRKEEFYPVNNARKKSKQIRLVIKLGKAPLNLLKDRGVHVYKSQKAPVRKENLAHPSAQNQPSENKSIYELLSELCPSWNANNDKSASQTDMEQYDQGSFQADGFVPETASAVDSITKSSFMMSPEPSTSNTQTGSNMELWSEPPENLDSPLEGGTHDIHEDIEATQCIDSLEVGPVYTEHNQAEDNAEILPNTDIEEECIPNPQPLKINSTSEKQEIIETVEEEERPTQLLQQENSPPQETIDSLLDDNPKTVTGNIPPCHVSTSPPYCYTNEPPDNSVISDSLPNDKGTQEIPVLQEKVSDDNDNDDSSLQNSRSLEGDILVDEDQDDTLPQIDNDQTNIETPECESLVGKAQLSEEDFTENSPNQTHVPKESTSKAVLSVEVAEDDGDKGDVATSPNRIDDNKDDKNIQTDVQPEAMAPASPETNGPESCGNQSQSPERMKNHDEPDNLANADPEFASHSKNNPKGTSETLISGNPSSESRNKNQEDVIPGVKETLTFSADQETIIEPSHIGEPICPESADETPENIIDNNDTTEERKSNPDSEYEHDSYVVNVYVMSETESEDEMSDQLFDIQNENHSGVNQSPNHKVCPKTKQNDKEPDNLLTSHPELDSQSTDNPKITSENLQVPNRNPSHERRNEKEEEVLVEPSLIDKPIHTDSADETPENIIDNNVTSEQRKPNQNSEQEHNALNVYIMSEDEMSDESDIQDQAHSRVSQSPRHICPEMRENDEDLPDPSNNPPSENRNENQEDVITAVQESLAFSTKQEALVERSHIGEPIRPEAANETPENIIDNDDMYEERKSNPDSEQKHISFNVYIMSDDETSDKKTDIEIEKYSEEVRLRSGSKAKSSPVCIDHSPTRNDADMMHVENNEPAIESQESANQDSVIDLTSNLPENAEKDSYEICSSKPILHKIPPISLTSCASDQNEPLERLSGTNSGTGNVSCRLICSSQSRPRSGMRIGKFMGSKTSNGAVREPDVVEIISDGDDNDVVKVTEGNGRVKKGGPLNESPGLYGEADRFSCGSRTPSIRSHTPESIREITPQDNRYQTYSPATSRRTDSYKRKLGKHLKQKNIIGYLIHNQEHSEQDSLDEVELNSSDESVDNTSTDSSQDNFNYNGSVKSSPIHTELASQCVVLGVPRESESHGGSHGKNSRFTVICSSNKMENEANKYGVGYAQTAAYPHLRSPTVTVKSSGSSEKTSIGKLSLRRQSTESDTSIQFEGSVRYLSDDTVSDSSENEAKCYNPPKRLRVNSKGARSRFSVVHKKALSLKSRKPETHSKGTSLGEINFVAPPLRQISGQRLNTGLMHVITTPLQQNAENKNSPREKPKSKDRINVTLIGGECLNVLGATPKHVTQFIKLDQ